ncbi:MAG: hypothetical protein U0133_01470 [Gemmatimonadales bacterium]
MQEPGPRLLALALEDMGLPQAVPSMTTRLATSSASGHDHA